MNTYDTKAEVLACLDKMTREIDTGSIKEFTTAAIASACHISRSLASQYLNELVRSGLVIKVNTRPVLFMHRKAAERYLQTRLERCEFDSVRDLLSSGDMEEARDFDKAIGFELSYGTCVDRLKSSIQYPPNGIPALIVGEHGTGKQLMSELTYEYGVNSGILPANARYIVIDCARYERSDLDVERDIFGGGGIVGAANEAQGGVVFINRIDHLSHAARELVLQRICEDGSKRQEVSDASRPRARFLLATARPRESDIVKSIARAIPIVVTLPTLSERGIEERTSLALHFLRVEGRRVAADVLISRGALRALVSATFDDNIDGLRACVTNCCASAYLNRDTEQLVIHTYNLPSTVIGAVEPQPDDDQLVSGDKSANDPSSRALAFFQRIIEPLPSYLGGAITFKEFFTNAAQAVRSYSDFMNFENQGSNPRISSYERLVDPIVEEVNRAYGIDLSRRTSRAIAQSLFTQLFGGVGIARWRQKHMEEIRRVLDALNKNLPDAGVVVEQISAKTKVAIGKELDELSSVILFADVEEALQATGGVRSFLGVVMCHGYATASSIADAANRILHQHVYESIDMTYDQEIADVVGQVTRLMKRYSHCSTMAILVDMGSLESIADMLSDVVASDIYLSNCVSTGLALEVGSALIAHKDLDEVLTRAKDVCAPRHSMILCSKADEAVVFCSESGSEAADRIRKIVQGSIPGKSDIQLVTCDFSELAQKGNQAFIFDSYRVRAIIGTMNPGISSVPFVGLEDILYQGRSEALDQVLSPALGPEGIAEFHSNLLRNFTLRSVIESITILNPEMLYVEADLAVQRLSELTGQQIDARRKIGIYVHLCGLIERLVTKNFVDAAPGAEGFVTRHPGFVSAFREAFADLCRRYRVEIPISEIVYVHHMLNVRMSERDERVCIAGLILEDE